VKARSDRFKRVRKIVVTPAYGRKYSSFMDLLLISFIHLAKLVVILIRMMYLFILQMQQ